MAVGTVVASILANLLGNWSLSTSLVFALCNAGQVLLMAALIQRYFGSAFSLDSLRRVLGLVAAAIVGTGAAAIGGTIGVVFVEGSAAPALTIWNHWLTSNVPGIVAVAPLLIGLVSAVRHPPPRSEIVEGVVALVGLTALSGLIVFLPREPLGSRGACRSAVSIAAVARGSLQAGLRGGGRVHRCRYYRLDDNVQHRHVRRKQFSDRRTHPGRTSRHPGCVALRDRSRFAVFRTRANEARLTRSNMMLQQERNNKLMNIDAITSAIVHEVRQPLAAIALNGATGIRWLTRTPPDYDEARAAMARLSVTATVPAKY